MKFAVTSLVMALLAAASVRAAQDGSPSGPRKEHAWLQQLVGAWAPDPAVPREPAGSPGLQVSERVRSIGDLWIVAESEITDTGVAVRSLQTLGYDPEQARYVGTWIDSTSSFLWTYQGTLDGTGKTLTLEAEGPGEDGRRAKYRDVIELVDRDHKVLTSWMQGEDGQWSVFVKAGYRRAQ